MYSRTYILKAGCIQAWTVVLFVNLNPVWIYTDTPITLTVRCNLVHFLQVCFQLLWYVHNVGKSLWYVSSLVTIFFGIKSSQYSERLIFDPRNSGFHYEFITSSQVTFSSVFCILYTIGDYLIKIDLI